MQALQGIGLNSQMLCALFSKGSKASWDVSEHTLPKGSLLWVSFKWAATHGFQFVHLISTEMEGDNRNHQPPLPDDTNSSKSTPQALSQPIQVEPDERRLM